MIAESLQIFISAQAELAALGINAYVKTPDTVASELNVPFCLIDYLQHPRQDLWELGDARRQQKAILSVQFCMDSFRNMRDIEPRFQRLIESAMTLDAGSLTHPGIDFIAAADLLRDSGDHMTYYSDQPAWFASPAPKVFKNEDANAEPNQISTGFSVNSAAGSVTFSTPNNPSDIIRATYKCGVIDFTLAGGPNRISEKDLENNVFKFSTIFDLEAFYYVKTNANRYI